MEHKKGVVNPSGQRFSTIQMPSSGKAAVSPVRTPRQVTSDCCLGVSMVPLRPQGGGWTTVSRSEVESSTLLIGGSSIRMGNGARLLPRAGVSNKVTRVRWPVFGSHGKEVATPLLHAGPSASW